MDLKLTLLATGKIETNLFEKSQNLYLYIPPGSAHPKGMIKGLIFGNTLRIIRLCSSQADATIHLLNFKNRLIARGYTSAVITPLYLQALTHAGDFVTRGEDSIQHPPKSDTSTKVFFTLSFIQRTQTHEPYTVYGMRMLLSEKGPIPFMTLATYSMKWSTLTASLLPTVDHLISRIGFLYMIFLVGGRMSQATWPSNLKFPCPFTFLRAG
jgi:hypothetical protein